MPNNLTGFTVPQLKALCKERRVVGYSKLAKSALIQKLTDAANNVVPLAETPALTAGSGANVFQEYSSTPSSESTVVASSCGPLARGNVQTVENKKSRATKKKTGDSISSSSLSTETVNGTLRGPLSSSKSSILNANSVKAAIDMTVKPGTKRPFTPTDGDIFSGTSTKKAKTLVKSLAPPSVSNLSSVQLSSSVFKVPVVPSRVQAAIPVHTSSFTTGKTLPSTTNSTTGKIVPNAFSTLQNLGSEAQSVTNTSGKRFQPLIVKGLALPIAYPQVLQTVSAGPAGLVETQINAIAYNGGRILYYLDFPLSNHVSLHPITLPPSLSQRKRVSQRAILLSALPDDDMIKQCIQVSRMFRYAGIVGTRPFIPSVI
jgi:hypothetical protein